MTDSPSPYNRIVSLTAALTETLFAIGVQDRLVGVTDTCDYPDEARQLPNVGCWFEPDLDKLFDLRPDLVLGLETAHARFRPVLEVQGIDVGLSNPATVEESLALIAALGDRLGTAERAQACVADLQERLRRLDAKLAPIPEDRRPTVSRVLHLSEEGIIVAGPRSFQYDVIARAGGRNVTGHLPESYPKVGFEQFRAWDPAVVFFCGGGRSFVPRLCADEKWRTLRAVRTRRVYQFDCGLTCRTGPRIVDMAELLHDTLYA